MESSVFGTPVAQPATVPPQEGQAAAPEAPQPEPVQAQPQEPQQAPEQGGEQPASRDDEVLAKLDELRQQMSQQGQPQQPEPTATDLLAALEAEEDPAAPTAEPAAPAEPEVDANAQQELEALQRFVDERAQQIVQPWMQRQAEREINQITQEYPDILSPEVLPQLQATVQAFINDTGDESLVYNPDFIRRAYKLVKAEQTEASAEPAEQVATQGASLETNAGQTQAGAPSPDEEYKSAVYGNARRPSVFG